MSSYPEIDERSELVDEQGYVAMLYGRLDDLRDLATARLAGVLRGTGGGTHQARSERDASAAAYADRIGQLNAVEDRLCFGRLDFDNDDRQYIGRLGLFAEDAGEDGTLLIDWRAPAARPFYLANLVSPDGVRRRRHIRTRGRTVVGLDDEILDASAGGNGAAETPTNEAALMAVLAANRTGQMADIVATIQAEQDRIIRSDLNGVLVVQGGPGTGKTAVALHRVAYLLYTYRERLEKRGVLVVGPNATFLSYIGQVLPSLGETGALLRTVGQLFPGLDARGVEPARVAELKGRAVMAEVIAAAVRDREPVPELVEIVFDGEPLRLPGPVIARAGELARESRLPHNPARRIFVNEIINALAERVAARFGRDLLDELDLKEIRQELTEDPSVQRVLDELWPELTAQRLLGELYASPERLAVAAAGLDPAERELLLRAPASDRTPAGWALVDWTPADVPLLDEAAELLGEDDTEERARAAARWDADVAYAEGVLTILDLEDEADPDILMPTDLIDASRLAGRHEEDARLSTAERAAADRRWAFGHIVVDEAQELSPMTWRLLMRRCPSRSMTVVGDVAQTGDPGGASSWAGALGPHLGGRWRLTELTVNYRTPAEIMAVATGVLSTVDRRARPPRSIRSSGVAPWQARIREYGAEVAGFVARERERAGGGKLAVIAPPDRVEALSRLVGAAEDGAALAAEDGAALAAEDGAALAADGGVGLAADVVVLDVRRAKGLEFDSVLVVDPGGIVAGSPRGINDLYVALTRATRRLGVLHTGDLPAALTPPALASPALASPALASPALASPALASPALASPALTR